MSTSNPFEKIAQQVSAKLQGASQAPADIQRNVQGVLRGAMERMEIVSREDFDIMMDVLTRTRERVEALEEQVASLENALKTQQSVQPSASVAQESTNNAQTPSDATKSNSAADSQN